MKGVAAVVAAGMLLGAVRLRPEASRGFEDITRKAGVSTPHHTRRFDNPYAHIMAGYTALGASASVADYDGDGFADVFVTDSAADGRNHLYHNNGNLTFTDVTADAGLGTGNDATNASADSLWFDINNDGRPDLLVVRFGHNQLFENLGRGKFRDVTKAAGLDRYLNAITAVAFDYDHDGFADLFVGAYFQPVNLFHPDTPRFFPESFETANNGGGVIAYRNNGNGTFTDVTAKIGLKTSGWTLDLGHGDANNDGWDDLYVACDFGADRFFVNTGRGTFADVTEKAIGIDTKKGMNAEWGDFDNDGLLDIYVTNITSEYMREGNFLWHNNGNLTFSDVSRETGTSDTGWGWGAKFFDYDNDGWLDLYVANGWVSAGSDSYVPDIFQMIIKPGVDLADARNWPPMGNKSLSGREKKRLFHNERGQAFSDQAAKYGVDSTRDGRGVAIADFDNDGRLDMFIANANAEPFLYHNVMPGSAHWAEFDLIGTRSNRFALGAQVRVTAGGRTLLRFVDGGNGFAGQSATRLHVGLGSATVIDTLEVRWPSGARQTFEKVPVDRIARLTEGVATLAAVQTSTPAEATRDPLAALEAALTAQPDDLRAGNDYRMAVIQAKQYDRAIAFFDKLVSAHPDASNAHLNFGFAYVDKIPAAGAITQVILASRALGEFTKSLELAATWLGYYTRGNSYLFWPRIFNRTHLGVADLQEALKIQRAGPKRPYHVRVFVALGDGYWKMGDRAKAVACWKDGLADYPDNAALKVRLSASSAALDDLIADAYDHTKRVDTSLQDLWANP